MGNGIITSVSNNTIKKIRALRHRRERAQQGTFLIEGIRIVAEAVQTGAELDCLVVSPELLTSDFAQELLQSLSDVSRIDVSSQVFCSLSNKEGPQGLAAVVRQRWEQLESLELEPGDLWVALEAPQDPGNLGTIMRTADAVGAAGLILIGNSVDPYDPGAVRASMGSLFSMRLVHTDVPQFIAWRQSQDNVALFGATGAGSQHYRHVTYRRPAVLLSGSEREGLSEQLLAACDHLVRIPMLGRCDSLNLAVATSVVLYEILEQSLE